MIHSASENLPAASSTQKLVMMTIELAGRRVWLPKVVYDGLPYFYLAAGFAAFFATLYVSEWFWVLPHYLLFSCACLHLAFAVSRMRRRAKTAGNGLTSQN
ncbi:MAG: hypothetical protein HKP32_05085 [Woeseia sp.]|nr:hypothetical protein [Woeseia sp.]MBT8096329.1 hypothetical protein [Woeseia sp.]NNL54506.1 hypothetical protein [Woeseia sp.]